MNESHTLQVSKLNANRQAGEAFGAATGRIYKDIGFSGLWNGLPVRIVMIGTLTGLQWMIYVSLGILMMVMLDTYEVLGLLQDLHGIPNYGRSSPAREEVEVELVCYGGTYLSWKNLEGDDTFSAQFCIRKLPRLNHTKNCSRDSPRYQPLFSIVYQNHLAGSLWSLGPVRNAHLSDTLPELFKKTCKPCQAHYSPPRNLGRSIVFHSLLYATVCKALRY